MFPTVAPRPASAQSRTLPCDFCDAEHATWRHPCRPFTGVLYGPELLPCRRAWNACDPCHRLIAADDWTGLEERSMTRFRATHPLYRPQAEAMIRRELAAIWGGFRSHRHGEPTRIGDR